MLLLALCYGMGADAKIVNETDHFFCGFDTQSEFEQWTLVDLNGEFNKKNVYRWDEETRSAFYSSGATNDGDDWLISPAIHLSKGKSFVLKANMFCDWSCKLTFALGKTNTAEGMVDVIAEEKEYDGNYYLCLKLPENMEEGDYYIGIRNRTVAWSGLLYLNSVEVAEDNGGALNIQVKRKGKDEWLEGASVSLSGDTYEDKTWQTNAEGAAAFNDLTPGKYFLSIAKEGFEPYALADIEVEARKEETLVAELVLKPVSAVKGVVVDEASRPVSGALVKLTGKKAFELQTAGDGSFLFPEVPVNGEYKLAVSKELKLTYKKMVAVGKEELNLGTLVLKDLLASPVKVYAENVEKGVFLSWIVPVAEKDFALDNGSVEGTFQMNSKDYVYLGNTFREPMSVNAISWALDNNYPTVDVYVFPLNRDGSFSTEPAFSRLDVPSRAYDWDTGGGWSELILDTPVVAPYGCVVAIGHSGSLTVLSDYRKLEGSVVCVDKNFENSGWFHSTTGNFFIRAEGVKLTSDLKEAHANNIRMASYSRKLARKADEGFAERNFTFSVWRYKDRNDPSGWEEIATDLKKQDYLDPTINSKEKGFYGYAIRAIYQDGRKSDYGYSAPIDHNMYTKVDVNVFTNTAVRHGNGAIVSLQNLDNGELVYRAETVHESVSFDKVLKGKYKMTVTKDGFADSFTEVALEDKDRHSFSVELLLTPLMPYHLYVGNPDSQSDCILSWNNEDALTEDFEEMNDFETDPQNAKGWTFFDADKAQTYGVALCKDTPYPNMHAPMAFMVFNPFKTTPDLSEYIRPRSGEKVLVSVSPETGARSDDYLFSPQLAFDSDFTFSFYAAAGFYGFLGNEEFMVGYTTAEPSPENVVWLTEKPQQVGGIWTPFSYILPKEARHAVIRGVSMQKLFFMLDDIKIGIAEPEIFEMALFNVMLDGEEFGTTYAKNINLGKLDPGKHIAKIQAVYTMADISRKYSDFAEIQFLVKESTGVSAVSQDKLFAYDEDAGKIVPGHHVDMISLYDMAGKKCGEARSGGFIPTKPYGKGVYVVRVVSGGAVTSHKVVLR